MKKIASSIVAAFAVSSFALAGGDIAPVEPVVETPVIEESSGNFYIGLGYSFVELNDLWDSYGYLYDDNYEQDALTFIAGYNFNDYVGIEGRYMVAVGDADYYDAIGDYSESLDNNFENIAIYVKPMLPINSFTLYGLLGYGKTTFNYPEYSDITASGFQYGAGVSYSFYENFSLFLDYTVLAEDDDIQIVDGDEVSDVDGDAVTFGLTYKF